jgi:hypothetical protein
MLAVNFQKFLKIPVQKGSGLVTQQDTAENSH